MDERGFTLAEMLAALMVIGLVLGAMAGGVAATNRLQQEGVRRTALAERSSALANALHASLSGQGPFSSAGSVDLHGDRSGFAFSCAAGRSCGVKQEGASGATRLVFFGPGLSQSISWPGAGLSLQYVGSKTVGDHWPPDNPTDWQRLRAIAVIETGHEMPVASARVWVEAPSVGHAPLPAPVSAIGQANSVGLVKGAGT